MTAISRSELLAKAKKTMPSVLCTSPEFVWRCAADTNVQDTWRKWGWVPHVHVNRPQGDVNVKSA